MEVNRAACLFMVISLIVLLSIGCADQTAKIDSVTKGQEVGMAMYKGSDRTAKLESAAKDEGKLMIYEGMNQKDLNALVKEFNQKYPFIKVDAYSASNSDEVLQRIMTEAKAGKMFADVIGLSEIPADTLVKEDLAQPYYTPEATNLSSDKKDSNGLWTMYRQQFYVAGYNTNLVKDPPKTYEDFLDPKWKGKLGIELNSAKWMATLIKYWGDQKGQDYFKKLAQQNLSVRNGLTLTAQLVNSGELPISITVLNHEMEKNKKSGAPVAWIPLEPVVSTSAKVLLPKDSAHPNAALLWIDFILSKDGQSIFSRMNRIPVRDDVPIDPPSLKNGFKYINVDTNEMVDNGTKWQDMFNALFINKAK